MYPTCRSSSKNVSGSDSKVIDSRGLAWTLTFYSIIDDAEERLGIRAAREAAAAEKQALRAQRREDQKRKLDPVHKLGLSGRLLRTSFP